MRTLVAIGGAINHKAPRILSEFIGCAGGKNASLVIIPQASAVVDTGDFYQTVFHELGVSQTAYIIRCGERSQADDAENLKAIRQASGIFIAGGNQMRLTSLFGGTRLEVELLEAYQRGAVLAGTSAGAAVLSKMMLSFGRSSPTPRRSLAQFTPGFGFTDKVLFDQHFRQRDRLGRLIYAVTTHPGLLGAGVDENTAAILEDDQILAVLGTGAVTIVDGRDITATDTAETEGHAPIAVAGLNVHVLTEGCRFDLEDRTAIIPKKTLLSE